MRPGTLTALLLVCVLAVSFMCVSGKKTKAKTYFTKYTRQKRKYCLFEGHEILPGSKWSTPAGCLKCTCSKKFLNCKPITKNRKKRKNLGCF